MSASVNEHEFPRHTAVAQSFVERAYYKDSYCVGLRNASATPVELFHAVFAHRPMWMKIIMVARNLVAARAGLDAPSAKDIMQPRANSTYEVGGTIGAWSIYALTTVELVTGRDNKHLDFRLSVLREPSPGGAIVVFSTVCAVNNMAGKVYLWFILPFHRIGLRWLIGSAASAGRL